MNSFQLSNKTCSPPLLEDSPNPGIPLTNSHQSNPQLRSQAQGRDWSLSTSSATPLRRNGPQHAMNLGSTASSTSAVAANLFRDSEMRTPKPPPFGNQGGFAGSWASAAGSTATQISNNNPPPPPAPFSPGGVLFESFAQLTLAHNRSEEDSECEEMNSGYVNEGRGAPPATRCNSTFSSSSDESEGNVEVHYRPALQIHVGRGRVQVMEEEIEPLDLEEELNPLFHPPQQGQVQNQGNSSVTAATATLTSLSPFILTQQSQQFQTQTRATVRRERSPLQEPLTDSDELWDLISLLNRCDAVLQLLPSRQ